MADPAFAMERKPQVSDHSLLMERLLLVLAPQWLSGRLADHWPAFHQDGMVLSDCRIERLHARGKHGFFVDCSVDTQSSLGRRQETLFVEVVPSGARERLRSVTRRLHGKVPGAVLEEGIRLVPDQGLLLRKPGLDERLPGLNFRYRPEVYLPCLFAKLGFNGWDVPRTAIELISHRLGKRAVLRIRNAAIRNGNGQPESLIVKASKRGSDSGRRAHLASRALWQGGFGGESDVRVPRSLAFFQDLNTEIMEDLPGHSLNVLKGNARMAGMNLAGRTLAKLHGTAFDPERQFTARDECALLSGWMPLFTALRPELAQNAQAAFARVSRDLGNCNEVRRVLLHRDYHDKQILIDGSRAGLIDFDTLCLGDPALDLGNFLAHLRLSELQEQADLSSLREAFLMGYLEDVPQPAPGHLEAYERSTLLRLACIYAVSTRWRHLSGSLLRMALE